MNTNPAPPSPPWTFTHEGDHCLLIRFGDTIDPVVNARARLAAERIHLADLPYISDLVPTFTTLGVHIDPFHPAPPDSASLAQTLQALLSDMPLAPAADATDPTTPSARLIRIPVCYDPHFGIDLTDIATQCGLTVDQVSALHCAAPLRVFMLGFAPGMAYMGLSDSRLAIGRRGTPRSLLAAGSVAIANRQTVIYPNDSPGGWNIVGATPLRLFDPEHPPYALYAPGDQVQFDPIDRATFERIKAGEPVPPWSTP